jgi:hypothetical protein
LLVTDDGSDETVPGVVVTLGIKRATVMRYVPDGGVIVEADVTQSM